MIHFIRPATAIAALLLATGSFLSVEAKDLTISQRQHQLINKIAHSRHSGDLTQKEANGLNEQAADILAKEARMKQKNGGKLSYADIRKIEKDLNDLSSKIHKKQLAKRVLY